MAILYGVAKIIYLVLYQLIRYRINVTRTNLKNSFPTFSRSKLKQIEKAYYVHLCNLFVEGVKMLSISRKEVMKRYRCKNPELVNQYFEQKKSVILMSSHYNNWEWMVLSLAMQFKHHGIGVGKENSNKSFRKTINLFRTRYGTEVVFAKTIRDVFQQYDNQQKPTAYMMLSDQAPGSVKNPFMVNFLHHAKRYDFRRRIFRRKIRLSRIVLCCKTKKTRIL